MADRRKQVIRAGLETLYFSGMHHLARQFLAGAGAILTFHRVRPALPRSRSSRTGRWKSLRRFSKQLITSLRAADVDLVSMDEVRRRLVSGEQRLVGLSRLLSTTVIATIWNTRGRS